MQVKLLVLVNEVTDLNDQLPLDSYAVSRCNNITGVNWCSTSAFI